MKSYANLWPEITSFENLYEAFLRARRGKRTRPDVADFEFNLEPNLLLLQRELLDGTYRPAGYRNFVVYEPVRRKISAAPFRDRVVHHALCRVIEPIFERVFIPDSYACRLGKGTHRALKRCREYIERYPYVLKSDISNFFPSVDHEILFGFFTKRIRCRETLRLIQLILASGAGVLADEYRMTWFPEDDLLIPLARPRSLPIGNLTSQFWANAYLHELDVFVTRTLLWPAYIRYVDDFLLFGERKSDLHEARAQIEEFLPRLRLTLHPNKTRVFPARAGVDFLGFVNFPEYRRVRRSNLVRARCRFRLLQAGYRAGKVSLGEVQASVQSWVAHLKHGETYRIREQFMRAFTFVRDSNECISDLCEDIRFA